MVFAILQMLCSPSHHGRWPADLGSAQYLWRRRWEPERITLAGDGQLEERDVLAAPRGKSRETEGVSS